MEYRILGTTGEKISEVGLGAWQFSESWGMLDYENAKKIISSAMVNGVNFIDTAIAYGWGKSEEFIGKSLKELGARDNFMIATKIPGEFLAEHDVILATLGSLRRLQTDHIDLMQIHWPPVWNNIPTCEYMRALEKLVSMGLIDYIGVSNFPPILLDEANSCLSREEIVSEQVRYNLIEREAEKEIIPYTLEAGMNLIAWSPLAKGALSGKYNLENLPKFTDVRAGEPTFIPQNFKEILPVIEKLKEIASKYSKTPAQVALNWLLTSYDNVIVIPGAKSPEQVAENSGASGWSLSFEDWVALDSLSKKVTIHRSLKAI
ncbi:MAG: aldo/keto reductase [Thermoprotei archaeon]|nr:aldo/keto reductase [Thermoprotei archaeon]